MQVCLILLNYKKTLILEKKSTVFYVESTDVPNFTRMKVRLTAAVKRRKINTQYCTPSAAGADDRELLSSNFKAESDDFNFSVQNSLNWEN